ncbi:site-specific integrase [Aureimonas flava]|nr:site-specific integrase [Aureimonas flava]
MKRSSTSYHQFVQRIPSDVIAKARGRTLVIPVGSETVTLALSAKAQDVRLSLRTRDAAEAKLRQAAVLGYLEGVWRSVREGPRTLTHQETVALAGDWYRALVADWSTDPGKAENWEAMRESIVDAQLDLVREDTRENWEQLERLIRPDPFLAERAISLEGDGRQRFLMEAGKALTQAAAMLQRNADGDYRPDPDAARFPAWTPPVPALAPPRQQKGEQRTVLAAFSQMAKERGYAPKTVSEWTRSLSSLTDHAQTTALTSITPDHLIGWTDELVARGLSAKTINETYLASAKALFRWARGKLYLPSNPAFETPKIIRRDDESEKRGFTLSEAQTILRKAEGARTAVRRWVPWLLAYSGARAGEVMQLRPQDVRKDEESGIWVLDITASAGRIKNKASARLVPVHPHLIEKGFVTWATSSKASRLFYEEREDEAEDGKRSRKSVAVNRLADWVRGLDLPAVKSGEVSPNHGWRHRFSTELVNLDVPDTLRKRLMGHTLEGQDNRYVGRIVMKRLHDAVAKLPAFALTDDAENRTE